jgi:DNA-binding NtrC family response regulator
VLPWGKVLSLAWNTRGLLQRADAVICVGIEEYEEARQRLRGSRVELLPGGVDLVVSDIKMPDRNGYEVFRSAKSIDPDIPVILMTGFGYDPHHSIVRSSQEGLDSFLFKPFQASQLLEAVTKSLTAGA